MIKKFLVIIVVLVLGAAGVWRLGFLPWGKEQAAVPGGYEVPLSTEDFEGALLGELQPQLDTTSSFLVRVREITDAAQLTGEEQAALDADEGMGTHPEVDVLEGLVAKTSRALEELRVLEPAEEVQEIWELAVQFYEMKKVIYEAQMELADGKEIEIDLDEYRADAYDIGLRCDELRAELHQRYGLGRL